MCVNNEWCFPIIECSQHYKLPIFCSHGFFLPSPSFLLILLVKSESMICVAFSSSQPDFLFSNHQSFALMTSFFFSLPLSVDLPTSILSGSLPLDLILLENSKQSESTNGEMANHQLCLMTSFFFPLPLSPL